MNFTEVSDIPVTTGGVALPTASSFMAPGTYIVNGLSYDCSRQGLYRWFSPSGSFINRVVVSTGASLDVYAVISAISWNHVHGTQTEYAGNNQLIANAGRNRKWSARCGYIAGMVAWLMPQLGCTGRVVNVTTTGPTNGYDDGHIVAETLHGTEWRMWDMTNGCYFIDANGKHLSTADFIAAIANGGTFPQKVRLDYDNKFTNDCAGSLDLGLYWERTLNTDADAEIWYRRIFQNVV
jgi:hypothetical protein